jgi:hypothetical protein
MLWLGLLLATGVLGDLLFAHTTAVEHQNQGHTD